MPMPISRGAQLVTFMLVGGLGYVVDVATFNMLRSVGPVATLDPTVARCLAVVPAMLVTYWGNRTLTWQGRRGTSVHREVGLFVVLNLIGFAISAATLAVSHDLLGLTTRLDDNIAANVVGVGLGTLFRFVTYRRYVFPAVGPV